MISVAPIVHLPSPKCSPLLPLAGKEPEVTLIDVVVKVMTRLCFGGRANSHSIPALSTINSSHHHQQLVDLRHFVIKLIQRAPACHAKALTMTIMQALLLSHRMLTLHLSNPQLFPLPALLSSPKNVFLAAVTMSEATLMDCQTSTKVWARLAGVSPRDVAQVKGAGLVFLQYSVHVGVKEFVLWIEMVSQWMRIVGSQIAV
ncbi:hypothetical protein HDU98_009925 [Podochytrium sp. JEL0797]|nr:hypothetical protein HDU98_009925 [Podochytrium sp. JEL0797]